MVEGITPLSGGEITALREYFRAHYELDVMAHTRMRPWTPPPPPPQSQCDFPGEALKSICCFPAISTPRINHAIIRLHCKTFSFLWKKYSMRLSSSNYFDEY